MIKAQIKAQTRYLMKVRGKKQGSSHENGGGAEEARTPDPLLAKQVLSQLSYSPLVILVTFTT